MRIELRRVRFIPKELESGILYIAEEFGAAIHLCACGCGSKVSTPLRPTKWSLEDTPSGPSLRPSVGNWRLPCRSHYHILRGEVVWSNQWSDEAIAAGRRAEDEQRQQYYDNRKPKPQGVFRRLCRWIASLFGF